MMSSHIGVSEILDKIEGENTTVWSDMVPMEFQTGLLSPNGTAERKIGECKTRGNVTWFLLNDMGHDLETQGELKAFVFLCLLSPRLTMDDDRSDIDALSIQQSRVWPAIR